MRLALLFLTVVVLLTGCQGAGNTWLNPDLQALDMNKEPLERMLRDVRREKIHSAYVLRDSMPVLEYYSDDKGKDKLYDIYSCTKTIVSACLGIALEQGIIENIDQPLSYFFPEFLGGSVNPLQQEITLQHLLTMTSGIDWPEWTTWNYTTTPLRQSPNWAEFVLARPKVHPPGQVFNYNSGGTHLLAVILQQQAGMSLLNFAEEYLFNPLGIEQVEWDTYDPQGYNYGGSGIRLSTRDMAKIGQLYLNHGQWEGKQIIPEAWVSESTSRQSLGDGLMGSGYGYLWWLSQDIFFASGYGGQVIYVVPELNLVAVFTSWLPETPLRPEHYLRTYIIPAVNGTGDN